tara:strand:+ start:10134 stop:10979 length:846 start_codon:yes stop_codon:yes gene_type:complete
MNERDRLIQMLIKEKGGTKKQYLQLMNKIAHHESGGTMDPLMKQYEGGPGRGKYQFENGIHKGGQTAINRMFNLYKEKGLKQPEWLTEAYKHKSFDASTLNSNQQDALFLANMKGHPKANFKNVWDGKETVEDFWANYHWTGKPSSKNYKADRRDRINSFKESQSTFKQPVSTVDNKSNDTRNYGNEMGQMIYDFNKRQNQQSLGGKLGINQYGQGGSMGRADVDKELNNFEGGGTHEQNSLGGIPLGVGSNGKPNSVEENETAFELKSGKYIFSDRIIIE